MSETHTPRERVAEPEERECDTLEKGEANECIKPEWHSLMPRESTEQVIVRSVICQYMFYFA